MSPEEHLPLCLQGNIPGRNAGQMLSDFHVHQLSTINSLLLEKIGPQMHRYTLVIRKYKLSSDKQ